MLNHLFPFRVLGPFQHRLQDFLFRVGFIRYEIELVGLEYAGFDFLVFPGTNIVHTRFANDRVELPAPLAGEAEGPLRIAPAVESAEAVKLVYAGYDIVRVEGAVANPEAVVRLVGARSQLFHTDPLKFGRCFLHVDVAVNQRTVRAASVIVHVRIATSATD